MKSIKRIYVRKYRDNGQVTAYVDWADGARTEGSLAVCDLPRYRPMFSFGRHMHALFQRAKRDGLRLERECW